ncbi:MAG TPA: peptidylprolyl isomerase [Cyclobacteriaceae bacterium]|jgi:cyclophilin family peptidyl-prolyl cis-trans isomerase|nr:peptidylprolyl isomerase [Cyclobacteriaceae bacterium]
MKKFFTIAFMLTLYSSFIQAQKKDAVVTIKTEYGNIIAILYDETPKHKANFIKLAKENFYDSILFHRIIDGFMIQTGDPESKKAKLGERLGNGGPGYTIDAEFSPNLFHEKGSLAAARMSDAVNPTKASSGSQFYIVQGKIFKEEDIAIDQNKFNAGMTKLMQDPENKSLQDSINQVYSKGDQAAFKKMMASLAPRVEKETGIKVTNSPEKIKAYTTMGGTPHLDGGYTVFGKVIQGLDVVDKIASQPRDQADRPKSDIRIMVTVKEMKKKKIKKLYGYHYPVVPKK